jgi:uncharacterized caspase-like protein
MWCLAWKTGNSFRFIQNAIPEEVLADAYAVVVGIESYQQSGISGVRFARNDATKFADTLVTRLDVPRGNIKLWLDSDATRTNFTEQLKYDIQSLSPDDKFYFFFAGHGLHIHGKNRLVVWDSHHLNPDGTTIILDDLLFEPLRNSGCQHSVLFIDACANSVEADAQSRDIVSDMDQREFKRFIDSNNYTAAFFACSSKEKSYSSSLLKHGIWTFHVLRALNGEEIRAVARDRTITGESLRDYLANEVPTFIREKTKLKGRQTPYALIGSSGAFAIASFPEPQQQPSAIAITPNFAEAFFRTTEIRPFKTLPGFTWKRKHTVPVVYSAAASAFASKLLSDEISEEVQTIYAQAKSALKLKSRQIQTGEESVDTDFFRFSMTVDQNPEDPGEARIQREISLRVPRTELPDDFDDIFPNGMEEMVVPIPGSRGSFKDLIDAVEDLAEELGATVEDNPGKGTIELTLSDGTGIVFFTKEELMVISIAGTSGCLAIIDGLADGEIERIIGTPPPLIGSE